MLPVIQREFVRKSGPVAHRFDSFVQGCLPGSILFLKVESTGRGAEWQSQR